MSAYAEGSVTAHATGVKIQGQAASLVDQDKIKAFSFAIQSRDLPKLKELVVAVPKAKAERAPSDDDLVNLGLYIATLDGLACDKKVVDFFQIEYGAVVPKFKAVNFYSVDKSDSNSPLCHNVMAAALPQMADISDAVVTVNNHYVSLLNSSFEDNFEKKATKYNLLLKEAAKLIAEACLRSSTDSVCALKSGFIKSQGVKALFPYLPLPLTKNRAYLRDPESDFQYE